MIGFFVTGFFLTEELTAVALQRRGIDLRARLTLLPLPQGPHLGLRHPLGLSFLVPFVAVFLMPGAVAGATMMARELLGRRPRRATGKRGPGDRARVSRPVTRPTPPSPSP